MMMDGPGCRLALTKHLLTSTDVWVGERSLWLSLGGRYSERFLLRYGYYTISNYPLPYLGRVQFGSYPSGFLGERFCRWPDGHWLQRDSTCALGRIGKVRIPTTSLDALSSTELVLASAYLP